jgi:hypothetical protein
MKLMEQIQMQKFEEKVEKKVVNALKKLFDLEDNPMTEEQALKLENLFRTDVSTVCLVEARTPEARLVLAKFMDKDYEIPYNLPSLEFYDKSTCEIVSRYSETYLKSIIGLLSVSPSKNGSIEVKMRGTYPAQFSNDHWKIVLAPRIEE